ncbi:MAG: response regulator [Oligoflexales bacterium]
MAKILAVDDSKTVRNMMGNILRNAGHEVIAAEDGEDGIQKLREHPDIQILIADINMPKMNGFEMLQAMNAYRMLSDAKTIFVTTEPTPEFIDKIMKQGAFAWIMKPFKQSDLCAVVEKALKGKA